MSNAARYGSLVLLFGLIAGTAFAQEQKPSGWTEPPVRGSAAPQSPDDGTAKPSAEAPAAVKPEDRAEARKTESPAAGPDRRVRRSAKHRRDDIRREAARAAATAQARNREVREESRRSRIARRPAPQRTYAYRAYPARPVYGWRQRMAGYEAEPVPGPLDAMRREGWGPLLGRGRARRIAEARAAGYIVMRSRTVTYPDGTRLRSLAPYDPDEEPVD